jgi:prepilin-type N-terminal cleavage/methylation domain-containing protein
VELRRITLTDSSCRTNDNPGFTLLEVLIAMAILGVGILSIGVAQLSALKMSSGSKHRSQAMYLAQDQLDEFLALPAGDAALAAAVENNPDPQGPVDIDPNDDDLTTYSRSWTIEPNLPAVGLTRITVRVEWEDGSNRVGRLQLQGIRGS